MGWIVSATALVLALSGCDRLFGIISIRTDGTTDAQVDGADGDLDGDGVPNAIDNCPTLVNPDQRDFDRDGVGDVCDNCPLDANAMQEDGDQDHLGDVCDPHKTVPGDCLVLLDMFADPGTFAAGWQVSTSNGSTPEISSTTGFVKLTPPGAGESIAMLAANSGATIEGTYDVEIRGTTALTTMNTAAYVVTVSSGAGHGLGCGADMTNNIPEVELAALGQTEATQMPLAASAVVGATRILMVADGLPTASCDVAIEGSRMTLNTTFSMQLPSTGGSGVIAVGEPLAVSALAMYKQIASTASCPTPIVR